MAQLGAQAAAHHLGEHRHYNEQNREPDDSRGHLRQGHLQADAGEEQGGKVGVAEHVKLGVEVLAALGHGDNHACAEGAGDIRHAKGHLRDVGHQQAEHKGDNHMAVHALFRLHHPVDIKLIEQEPGHRHKDEEAQNLQQHHPDAHAGIGHAADDGQGDDAQHVIDDGSAQNGVARAGFQLAQLLQGLHGDAHRGGGEDNADEHVLQEHRGGGVRFDDPGLVEEIGQGKAAANGHQHADEGNDKGRLAAVLQLVYICFHAGAEHHHNDTYLRRVFDKFRLLNHV